MDLYIWLSEKLAIRNSHGDIDIKIYSDHVAIRTTWDGSKEKQYSFSWKLPKGLLKNKCLAEKVKKEIQSLFEINRYSA